MERILVALDRSSRAPAVLETAIDLARRTGARLSLLRAVTLPPELPMNLWPVSGERVATDFLEASKKELAELAAKVPLAMLENSTVQLGVAWDTICAAAREEDVDLIVIGSHGHGLLDRILGTTAAKVVNHADRSVMVVRATDDAAS